MQRLNSTLPGGLSVASVLAADPDVVHDCIRQVGFHNNKIKYITQTARILDHQYHGDIPRTVKDLCALPGVGPKMANLCVQAAWGELEGIGVDIHVHRITNRFKWHQTKTPEQTRVSLESWLPKPYWPRINTLLVGFGQTMCSAVNPKCAQCKLAEQLLCPASTVKNEMRKRASQQGTIKREDNDKE